MSTNNDSGLLRSEVTAAPDAGPPAPRLVYTQASVLLGRLVERTAEGWRVDLGSLERTMEADPSVDPALLDEACADGARVLVDASGTPIIVGVVATRRAVGIDREGHVDVEVESFVVAAKDQVLLKVPGAFIQAKKRAVEVYGDRVLTRARDLAKILAAMIKLG